MSWIMCKCGNIIRDSSDYLSYKGEIMSNKELDAFYELAEECICSDDPDREKLYENFTYNTCDEYIRYSLIYQCEECGRILIEDIKRGGFCVFAPEGHDNKDLLDFEPGEKIPVK